MIYQKLKKIALRVIYVALITLVMIIRKDEILIKRTNSVGVKNITQIANKCHLRKEQVETL